MKKHYKYIHIFWGCDFKFFPNIARLLNAPENRLEPEEHLILTNCDEVYNTLKENKNISLLKTNKKNRAFVINKYGSICDWIFIHNLCSPIETLKIKNKYCKKIIWRTWGSDISSVSKNRNQIKAFLKKIIYFFYKKKVRSFFAVGIANYVDKLNVINAFGNHKFFYLSYTNSQRFKILADAKKGIVPHSTLNIMIGHSGYENDYHIQILQSLLKFKDENICIYLPLSYGDEKYIDEVKKYALEHFGNKIVIIDEFMNYKDYCILLSKIDIAFLLGRGSYAIGNIAILTYLKKKIILNSDGILKKAFDDTQTPYHDYKYFNELSFDEFAKPLAESDFKTNELSAKPFNTLISYWQNMLTELNDFKQRGIK